ncbi:disintegrin and metalloproteinase domain-containing protein 32-like [Eulemur rufifrons]|uniref:disintegrin and metalloproteinase domain-containing protein 32-like n=1 Tax=Eulemur rufifrons TaxID=859984 RepID=UPI0037433C45
MVTNQNQNIEMRDEEFQTWIVSSQNSFVQIVVPEKIQTNTNDTSETDNEQISYIIPIDERPYTVHLKQRYFVADNFMVYLYNQGSVNSHSSNIETQCHYQGNIEGYPNSAVTLSTCSGLRGILQLENVSYGIEPLESAIEFQHLLYKLGKENNEFSIFDNNNRSIEKNPMDYNIFISEKLESDIPDLFPLYLEIHIVVDKALYDYLGSDSMIVTNKVIKIVGLVNLMFTQFKVTVVLSSLELWSDKDKISTAGGADELLHRFLEWKQSYLILRPHDIAYLFTYRDYPYYVGATFPGKMCVTSYSAGIVLYPKEITLEAFSVTVTQLLALSLGISYDDPKKCQCSETTCIMNPDAMQFRGMKTFSSCSLSDFKHFVSNVGARCLQNKPQMQIGPKPVCGNGIVEGNEICDCGTAEQCGPDNCCNPKTCRLITGAQCHSGLCCRNCQVQDSGFECRPRLHPDCDISEFCNGSSSECGPDITIQNGNRCKNRRFMCYGGDCPDPDARCESIFGVGSHSAPTYCYEEMQTHTDRFGNCGKNSANKYIFCGWRNILCGRLVCTFPFRTPFQQDSGDVIYAYVRNRVCVTLDPRLEFNKQDTMAIKIGSTCDFGRPFLYLTFDLYSLDDFTLACPLGPGDEGDQSVTITGNGVWVSSHPQGDQGGSMSLCLGICPGLLESPGKWHPGGLAGPPKERSHFLKMPLVVAELYLSEAKGMEEGEKRRSSMAPPDQLGSAGRSCSEGARILVPSSQDGHHSLAAAIWAEPDQKVAAKQILADPSPKIVPKEIPAECSPWGCSSATSRPLTENIQTQESPSPLDSLSFSHSCSRPFPHDTPFWLTAWGPRCIMSLPSLIQDQLWTVGHVPPPSPAQRAWLAAGSLANPDVCSPHLPPDRSLSF